MLKGRLVDLWPVSRKDLENLHTWANDESLTFLSSGSESANQNNNPLEALQAQYEKNLNSHHLWEHGTVFIVYSKATQEPIGKCDYRNLNPVTRAAEIGLTIGERDYWGRGYGKDIIYTLLNHLFYTLNLERVQLDTWSGNHQALRLYEKTGFQREGRLRRNEFVQGSYYDTILMGILKSEFESSTR